MALPKISAALVCALWLLMLHSCHAHDTMLTDSNRKNLSDKVPENNPKTYDDKPSQHNITDDKDEDYKDYKTPHHKSQDDKTQHQKDKTSSKSDGKSEIHNTPKPPKDSEPTQKAPQNPSNRGPQYPPQDWVDAHNAIRKTEGVVLMTWNESLADCAWNGVQKIARNCKDIHHSGGPWGECIFEGDGNATAKEIVDYWASEKEFWDPKTKKCQDGQDCGHYLQVVNPNSPALGCAKAKCANDPFYWIDICNYIW